MKRRWAMVAHGAVRSTHRTSRGAERARRRWKARFPGDSPFTARDVRVIDGRLVADTILIPPAEVKTIEYIKPRE